MASELTLAEWFFLRKHCSTHLTQVYKNLYQAVVTTPNAFERPVWWREVGQKVEPESRQVAPPRAKLWVASTDCDFLLPNFWKLCTNIYCVKWILIYLFIIVVIKYIMLYSKLFTSWWKIRFLTFTDCLLAGAIKMPRPKNLQRNFPNSHKTLKFTSFLPWKFPTIQYVSITSFPYHYLAWEWG